MTHYISLSGNYPKKVGKVTLRKGVNLSTEFNADEVSSSELYVFLDKENVITNFTDSDTISISAVEPFTSTAEKAITLNIVTAENMSVYYFKDVNIEGSKLAELLGGKNTEKPGTVTAQATGTLSVNFSTLGDIRGYETVTIENGSVFGEVHGGKHTEKLSAEPDKKQTFKRSGVTATGSITVSYSSAMDEYGDRTDIHGYANVTVTGVEMDDISAASDDDFTLNSDLNSDYYDKVNTLFTACGNTDYYCDDNGLNYDLSMSYQEKGNSGTKKTVSAAVNTSRNMKSVGTATIIDSVVDDIEWYKTVSVSGSSSSTGTNVYYIEGGDETRTIKSTAQEIITPATGGLHTVERTAVKNYSRTNTSTGSLSLSGYFYTEDLEWYKDVRITNVRNDEEENFAYVYDIEGGNETYKYTETIGSTVRKNLTDSTAPEVILKETNKYSETETNTATGTLTIHAQDQLYVSDGIEHFKDANLYNVDVYGDIVGGNYSGTSSNSSVNTYSDDGLHVQEYTYSDKNTTTETATGTFTAKDCIADGYDVEYFLNVTLDNCDIEDAYGGKESYTSESSNFERYNDDGTKLLEESTSSKSISSNSVMGTLTATNGTYVEEEIRHFLNVTLEDSEAEDIYGWKENSVDEYSSYKKYNDDGSILLESRYVDKDTNSKTAMAKVSAVNSTIDYDLEYVLNLNLDSCVIDRYVYGGNYTNQNQVTYDEKTVDGRTVKNQTSKSSSSRTAAGKAVIESTYVGDDIYGFQDLDVAYSTFGSISRIQDEANKIDRTAVTQSATVGGNTDSTKTTTEKYEMTTGGTLDLIHSNAVDTGETSDISGYQKVFMQNSGWTGNSLNVSCGTGSQSFTRTVTDFELEQHTHTAAKMQATRKSAGSITVEGSKLAELGYYTKAVVRSNSEVGYVYGGGGIKMEFSGDMSEDNMPVAVINGTSTAKNTYTHSGSFTGEKSTFYTISGYKDVTLKNCSAEAIVLYDPSMFIDMNGNEMEYGDVSTRTDVCNGLPDGKVQVERTENVTRKSTGKLTMTDGALYGNITDFQTVTLDGTILSAAAMTIANCGTYKAVITSDGLEFEDQSKYRTDEASDGDIITEFSQTSSGKLVMKDVYNRSAGALEIENYADVVIENNNGNLLAISSVSNCGVYNAITSYSASATTPITNTKFSTQKASGSISITGNVLVVNVLGYQTVTLGGDMAVSTVSRIQDQNADENIFVKGTLNLKGAEANTAYGYHAVNVNEGYNIVYELTSSDDAASAITVKKGASLSGDVITTSGAADKISVSGSLIYENFYLYDGNDSLTVSAGADFTALSSLWFGDGKDTVSIKGFAEIATFDMGNGDDKITISKGGVLKYNFAGTSTFGEGKDTLDISGDLILTETSFSSSDSGRKSYLDSIFGSVEKLSGKGNIFASSNVYGTLEAHYEDLLSQYKIYDIGNSAAIARAFTSSGYETGDNTSKKARELCDVLGLDKPGNYVSESGWLCAEDSGVLADTEDWLKFTVDDGYVTDADGNTIDYLNIMGLEKENVVLYDAKKNQFDYQVGTCFTWAVGDFAHIDFSLMTDGSYLLQLKHDTLSEDPGAHAATSYTLETNQL